ncbi:piggyBac transposable element-derived protein 2 isoform X1 [Anabrus simplex]|uniref:piggyBac transposable element-derived protein 2 isoform X1 n=1 Tax=Anabrus simplex TaxID=316456 RepID=UPI0035A36046
MEGSVRERCLQLPRVESSYSIDEHMVPFTGRCKLKQYIKNKPRPVGLKNFVITTTYGLVIDFEFYQGKSTPLPETQLGLGPAVVIRLAATVPEGSCLYFDRYFTRELKLHATGTIMANRIKNVHFSPDNKLKRGDIQSYVRSDEQVVAVKWRDSKCVTMASTCHGADPVDSSNAASEETNEDDPLSENPHQSDGDLQPVCSDSVMQDCKHEIVFEERVTKIEPSVDSSDTTSGIDIVKFDPDFEFSPVLKKRDSEQNEVLEHVSTVKKERDNFDIFGELVAHKLRHLRTDYARTTVEHLISNILYEASMGKYDFPESNASSSASSQVTSSLISNL